MKTSCSRDERRCDATRAVAAGLVFWGGFWSGGDDGDDENPEW